MKKLLLLSLAFCLCFCLCACSKNTPVNETTPSTAIPSENEVVTESTVPNETETKVAQENITEAKVTAENKNKTESNTSAATEATSKTAIESKYKRTGKMKYSDSADNKYLSAVAEKYSLSPKNLAAIYTVPDNNGNLVLEFSGVKNINGKLIRSETTLVNIYTVDKELNVKKASRIPTESDYETTEANAIFFVTTTYIMPEFEAELKG